MENQCILVQELLPLYAEDLCTPESKALIRRHLDECEHCRSMYRAMQAQLPVQQSLQQGAAQAKEPFRRVKRYYILRTVLAVAAAVLLLALGWLTMGSLAGEGYTLASFSSWRNAQKAMDAAIQGDVQGMEKYFYYGGVFPNGPLSAQQMLQQLQAVEQTYGLTLEKAVSSVEAAQEEDGFMYCSVTLTVRHYGTRYQLVLKGHPFEQGRIGFMQPTLLWTLDQTTGELAVPEWLDSLQQALCTYNPG